MFKNYTFWLKASIVFQWLTAMVHSMSLINKMQGSNDTEKQLLDLMNTYHLQAGAGFTPTMQDLMTSFSIGFTLLLIFGGLINLFLLRKKADPVILKGLVGISLIIFGLCFVAMLFLTFLPPIICLGLITVSLLMCYLMIPAQN